MENNLLKLQSDLRDKGILISFSGRFSQGIIQELGEAIKKRMEAEDRSKNDIYNVFSIFIEQTQNITNYAACMEGSSPYDKIANSGIVSIGKTDFRYFIWSGNMIDNNDAYKLKERLDFIIPLDKNQLKKLYKEQLKKELEPGCKTAGMGLIDIARKASLPIEYSVHKLDEHFSFFEIRVTV